MGVYMPVKKSLHRAWTPPAKSISCRDALQACRGRSAHTFARSPYSSSQDGGCYQQPLQAAAHCAASTVQRGVVEGGVLVLAQRGVEGGAASLGGTGRDALL